MTGGRTIFTAVLALVLLFGGALPAWAERQKPLLMPGKSTLYQRVLARPGAMLYISAGAAHALRGIKPFSVFYLYDERRVGTKRWLQVGTDSHGSTQGWVPEEQLIPWNQALTVAFRDPARQNRVLLFKDREGLKELIRSNDQAAYRELYQRAVAGTLDEASPVIAIQPERHIDIREDFYLVPIQQHEDIYLGSEQAMLLQVTTVPLKEHPPSAGREQATRAEGEARPMPRRFRSGLVFVTDATNSMGPYIDRTREAVRKVYHAIDRAGLKDEVSFGLVAYRDSLSASPELEYLVRTFVPLEAGTEAAAFFEGAAALTPAAVSSQDFIEDAYAGIKRAIDELGESDYAARYVVLITDAGARSADDPLSSTGLSEEQLRALALEKGVSIWVLHLRTPIGRPNHAAAARQYRAISRYPGIGDFYYGVKMGRVQEFGRVLDALAAQITEQVRSVVEVERTRRSRPEPALAPAPDGGAADAADQQLAEFQQKVAKLGYALRMRYLQRSQGGAVPEVFNAWLVDRDFQDPALPTLDVRVLLTRDQLSDLQHVLKQVLIAAEEGLLSPRNFLNDLKSLSATLSRDPDEMPGSTRATSAGGSNLADLGYMREYIEDLPYTGEVMSLSLEDWADWPAKRQLEFTHRLERKIRYYQALHNHTDLWISLDGGPITGDAVFPIALEMLP